MNPNHQPYRILFIDDDPQIRRMTRLRLQEDGYKLCEASSGVEGIISAIRQRPDLILLDVMMPGIDGYEVCKRLRENPRTANPCINGDGHGRDCVKNSPLGNRGG